MSLLVDRSCQTLLKMADERTFKKMKVEPEIDAIFCEFLKDKEKVETLRGAFLALFQGWRPLKLSLLKVKESNARISESFGRASCYTTLYTDDDGKKKVYQMGEIFKYGMAVLNEYLDEEPKIPKDKDRRYALAKLLKFISCDHKVFFQAINYEGKEGEWAITVAQHLLSPLSVANGYIIDSYPGLRTIFDYPGDQRCPCGKDDLVGRIGDTTFGCKDGWHGRTDILMDDQLPVYLEPDDTNLRSDSSATEIKTSENFSDNEQIVAQTIVFSFLQRKKNKEILNNLLVPGIGISVKNVVAYFYDCEEDVLLTTVPLLLKEESPQLDIYTVIFLWLTLNYKYFCSGITDDMKCCKAEFFEVVGNFLDMYRNDVTRPVQIYNDHDKSEEEKNAWVQKQLPVKSTNEIERYGMDFMKVPM